MHGDTHVHCTTLMAMNRFEQVVDRDARPGLGAREGGSESFKKLEEMMAAGIA